MLKTERFHRVADADHEQNAGNRPGHDATRNLGQLLELAAFVRARPAGEQDQGQECTNQLQPPPRAYRVMTSLRRRSGSCFSMVTGEVFTGRLQSVFGILKAVESIAFFLLATAAKTAQQVIAFQAWQQAPRLC